jgi:hypothetical protein
MSGVEEVIETALSKYIKLGLVGVKRNMVKNKQTEKLLFVDLTKKSQI